MLVSYNKFYYNKNINFNANLYKNNMAYIILELVNKIMNLKQLKYFLAIAEEGQITAAADKLHIAQPPLSYQLKLLEKELGVELVSRGPRSVSLTGPGELLRKRAEQILEMVSSAEKEVMNFGKDMYGVLSIGAISSSGGVVPNSQMIRFTKNHPNIKLAIHEGNTFAVIEMLEKGMIELGIVRTPFQHKMLKFRYAPKEPMVALMTENNLCGKKENTITLQELNNVPLIIYRRFDSLINESFAKIGIEPMICCKNDDARTTILWAHAGLGVGLVPKSAALAFTTGDLICKEIQCEDLVTRLAVVWVKDRYLSAIGQKFVELFE